MMKKIFYLLLITGVFFACTGDFEEEIHWDLEDYPDKLMVESTITNEYKTQSVILTLTSPYLDTMPPRPVTGASARIIEGGNIYTFTESDTMPGVYLSDVEFAGQPLKTYRLEITLANPVDDLLQYNSESTMPEGVDVDSALFYIYEMPEFDMYEEEEGEERDTTILGVYYFGEEPEGTENYYLNKVYCNSEPIFKTAKEYYIYSDDYRNGENVNLSAFIYNLTSNDTITFRIYSIEKTYYKFIEGIKNADQSGGMYSISGPPANAIGNIEEGKGMGYFAAAYVSQISGIARDMRFKK